MRVRVRVRVRVRSESESESEKSDVRTSRVLECEERRRETCHQSFLLF
jgi:hypothetical protein